VSAVGEAAAGVPSRGVYGDIAEPAGVPLATRRLVDDHAAAAAEEGEHDGGGGEGCGR